MDHSSTTSSSVERGLIEEEVDIRVCGSFRSFFLDVIKSLSLEYEHVAMNFTLVERDTGESAKSTALGALATGTGETSIVGGLRYSSNIETKVTTWDDLAFNLIILGWNVKHRVLQNVDPWEPVAAKPPTATTKKRLIAAGAASQKAGGGKKPPICIRYMILLEFD
ncbi:hypothetical protein Tco_1193201 [Tanacetum coccineum]